MPTDHGTNAAATTGGYQRIQLDRGGGKSPRFVTRYEKPIVGEAGSSGGLLVAEGTSDVSQAAADTQRRRTATSSRASPKKCSSGSIASMSTATSCAKAARLFVAAGLQRG
jgi:hypothetical protein